MPATKTPASKFRTRDEVIAAARKTAIELGEATPEGWSTMRRDSDFARDCVVIAPDSRPARGRRP